MKEIVAIVRPNQSLATRKALEEIGVYAYTVTRALGRSRQGGLRYARRWFQRSADIRFLPKRIFWIILEDDQVEAAILALEKANCTGRIGDGRIFVIPIEDQFNIREAWVHEVA